MVRRRRHILSRGFNVQHVCHEYCTVLDLPSGEDTRLVGHTTNGYIYITAGKKTRDTCSNLRFKRAYNAVLLKLFHNIFCHLFLESLLNEKSSCFPWYRNGQYFHRTSGCEVQELLSNTFWKTSVSFLIIKHVFFIPLQRQHDTRGPGGENRAGKITSKYLNDISNMIFWRIVFYSCQCCFYLLIIILINTVKK